VIDFTNNLPITQGSFDSGVGNMKGTTAWAAGDVLQIMNVRPGQTVMGVQVEILTPSQDALDSIDIGYGSDTARWGRYLLNEGAGQKNDTTAKMQVPEDFVQPLYFSSRDTIDITVNRAALQGKIRLIVHLLEDDR
jgi:hypothetical protein